MTWLEERGQSKDVIEGRETDVSMIASSLYRLVREAYEINKVPYEVLLRLESLTRTLDKCESEIQWIIQEVERDYLNED